MQVSSDTDLWVSWGDYNDAIEDLMALVYRSGWQFDHVLCLARGGLRPGDVFSRVFNVPLAILSTSSYRLEAGTVRGELDIAKHITMPTGTLGGRVLLVDDLVDSGITLENVQSHLQQNFPAVTEVKSAVIWYKACSSIKPDYYLQHLPHNPWIHQPFENYDDLGPEQLMMRIAQRDASAK
jgi:hypoxanthine phosphoribosyltransferase